MAVLLARFSARNETKGSIINNEPLNEWADSEGGMASGGGSAAQQVLDWSMLAQLEVIGHGSATARTRAMRELITLLTDKFVTAALLSLPNLRHS